MDADGAGVGWTPERLAAVAEAVAARSLLVAVAVGAGQTSVSSGSPVVMVTSADLGAVTAPVSATRDAAAVTAETPVVS